MSEGGRLGIELEINEQVFCFAVFPSRDVKKAKKQGVTFYWVVYSWENCSREEKFDFCGYNSFILFWREHVGILGNEIFFNGQVLLKSIKFTLGYFLFFSLQIYMLKWTFPPYTQHQIPGKLFKNPCISFILYLYLYDIYNV